MDTPVTLWQLIAGIITMLVAAFSRELYQLYSRYKDSKDKESAMRQTDEKERRLERREETEKVMGYYDDIVEEYARQLTNLRTLEAEVQQLRPLVLKVALQAQELQQAREDKEDWKKYATRLSDQLESLGHVPRAFRRTPHDDDTKEKIRTISHKMKAIKREDEQQNGDSIPGVTETPTIVSSTVQIQADEVTVEKEKKD